MQRLFPRQSAATRRRRAQPGGRAVGGFTLIELMVTIFVAAILLAIAIPSFRHLIASTTLSSTSNDLMSALKYARTEAINRGDRIAVTASSSNKWDDGWQVVARANNGDPDTVLRRHDAIETNYHIAPEPAGSTSVSFDARGATGGQLCFELKGTQDAPEADARHLLVLPSGSLHSTDNCN